jgi:hypothetical protein
MEHYCLVGGTTMFNFMKFDPFFHVSYTLACTNKVTIQQRIETFSENVVVITCTIRSTMIANLFITMILPPIHPHKAHN